jgi:predicted phosphodiesterase
MGTGSSVPIPDRTCIDAAPKTEVWLPPPVLGEYTMLVCSDLHYASVHCLPEAINEYFQWGYENGARVGFDAGDTVAGSYNFLAHENLYSGAKRQALSVVDELPRGDGFNWWRIDGNHDETHEKASGMPFGELLQGVAAAAGRTDIHYLGARGATFNLGYTGKTYKSRVELWHPKGVVPENPENSTRVHLRKTPSQFQPDIIATGHLHKASYFEHMGTHCLLAGTFEGCGSNFSKSLSGGPAVGGWLVKIGVVEGGVIRDFYPRFRSFRDHRIMVTVPI